MSAPHSNDVSPDRLPATMEDQYPRINLLGEPSVGIRPAWAKTLDRVTTDLPAGVSVGWASKAQRYNSSPGGSFVPVDPAVPYRFEVWLKASKVGSQIFIEPRGNDGAFVVERGITNGGSVATTHHILSGVDLTTSWVKHQGVILMRSTAQDLRIHMIYFNHPNGTATDAVVSMAGMRLEPMYSTVGHKHPPADLSVLTGSTVPSATTFYRGDGQWIVPTNTTYSVMSEAEATAGTATTARTTSAAGLKGVIQRWATGTYSTAISAIGQALNKAATAAEARAAIGAGTSNLAIGTTSSTAKAGNYTPTWGEVTSKPTSFSPSTHTHTTAQVTGLDAALAGKVIASGATTTLWTGSQSAYDALPTATRNAVGFIAVIV